MIPTNMDILVKTLRRGEIRRSLRIIFNIANPPFVHSKNRVTGIRNIRVMGY